MKKIYVVAALAFGALFSNAQETTTVDFESFEITHLDSVSLDTQYVANSANDFFQDGALKFGATQTISMWGTSYSGFTYSNRLDTLTAGYTNAYSTYAGAGASGSAQFAVYYPTDTIVFETAHTPVSVDITNNTYAALSMKNGDSFAKQFGSTMNASGDVDGTNGEDFFSVRFFGWDAAGMITDTVEIFLADFRGTDAEDYILKDWTNFDLSALGSVKSITFGFTSSDMGTWGINTPLYFAMDNLKYNDGTSDVTVDFDNLYLPKQLGTEGSYIAQNADDEIVLDIFSFGAKANAGTWGTYYTGFTVSNRVDTITAGYTNPYSAYAGAGANASNKYAVYYPQDTLKLSAPKQLHSVNITNNTYAALSMKNGDAFAKQFGSSTNAAGEDDGTNGEDFFYVNFIGWDANGNMTDSLNIYLADYRGTDAEDYILKDWKNFDLTSLGVVSYVTFSYHGTDYGDWGLNTPKYFAMDDLSYVNSAASVAENDLSFGAYPNPTSSILNVVGTEGKLTVTNLNGKVVYSENFNGNTQVNVSSFVKGMYLVTVANTNGVSTQKVIVK